MLLPAVGDAPDGVARWRVTADGDTHTVQSQATWVGAAETTPPAAWPLGRPVRTVVVALAGHEDLSAELRVVDQADPVLFFNEDGRRLAGTVSLPRAQVWIMHPAERELDFTGEAVQVVEPAVPFGWDGWRLRLVSLENVQAVGLRTVARTRWKPAPGHGCCSMIRSPASPRPSARRCTPRRHACACRRTRAPTSAGTPRSGARAAARRWSAASSTRPTADRPLGRGPPPRARRVRGHRPRPPRPGAAPDDLRRRGPVVAYQPQVRLLTRAGLAAGTARLTAAAGAAAQPAPCASSPPSARTSSSTAPTPGPSRWSSPRRTCPSCARAPALPAGPPPWCTWSPRTSPTRAAC